MKEWVRVVNWLASAIKNNTKKRRFKCTWIGIYSPEKSVPMIINFCFNSLSAQKLQLFLKNNEKKTVKKLEHVGSKHFPFTNISKCPNSELNMFSVVIIYIWWLNAIPFISLSKNKFSNWKWCILISNSTEKKLCCCFCCYWNKCMNLQQRKFSTGLNRNCSFFSHDFIDSIRLLCMHQCVGTLS